MHNALLVHVFKSARNLMNVLYNALFRKIDFVLHRLLYYEL